ncbi:hypothetical protein HNP48_001343 [Acidovorax soli]|jgi:hypothetical protein|uniref:Uncharacterized protein n=1 Tax=Acidovorax soli TaxID=592050 RepID=A0A7X0PBR0_9BURK|nr:hypothetical protein [Acidovorax soli]MBB6558679.1 hypothetical protein [Acidovorax soli]
MVNARGLVKVAHEKAIVDIFLEELNRRHRSTYVIAEQPDPPDAIIRSKRACSWVEVTMAPLNKRFAADIMSHATLGETPKPMESGIVNPDAQFLDGLVEVIKKKLEKGSYSSLHEKYGSGYLLVSVQNPFFDLSLLPSMHEAWEQAPIRNLGYFRSVYLAGRRKWSNGYFVHRWLDSSRLASKCGI